MIKKAAKPRPGEMNVSIDVDDRHGWRASRSRGAGGNGALPSLRALRANGADDYGGDVLSSPSDEAVAALNAAWRGKDRADQCPVLSAADRHATAQGRAAPSGRHRRWPMAWSRARPRTGQDIARSHRTSSRPRRFCICSVIDHENDGEAAAMEALEIRDPERTWASPTPMSDTRRVRSASDRQAARAADGLWKRLRTRFGASRDMVAPRKPRGRHRDAMARRTPARRIARRKPSR